MQQGSVVVAEDSASVRHVISAALRPYGFSITVVDNRREVLARCRELPPDVVLLDVEMAHLDGFATLDGLRAVAGLSDVPVLFLTGRAGVDDVVRGIERGVHDYVRKPVEPAELLARVNAALRFKRLADQVRTQAAARSEPAGTHDALTGLPTRADLDAALPRLAGASAKGVACGAVMIEVDGLAAVNERYGVKAGDEVLRVVARRLASRLRAADIIGRWAGAEFLALLPGTDLTGSMLVAERLRSTISRTAMQVTGVGLLEVTVSCGVASNTNGVADALVRTSVSALGEAKAAGCNVVRAA